MTLPFIVFGDFQTSKKRVFIFNNNDPRIPLLKIDDIVTTNDGCWKLIEEENPYLYVKSDKLRDIGFYDNKNYRAFSVRKVKI